MNVARPLICLAMLIQACSSSSTNTDQDALSGSKDSGRDPYEGGLGGTDAAVDGAADSSLPGCVERTLAGSATVPDVLVVLDRSGSMAPNGNPDGVDRWAGSVAGVKAVTGAFENKVRFGLMTFPTGSDVCEAGALDVAIDLKRAGSISAALDKLMAQGSTPTTATLDSASAALAASSSGGTAVSHPKHLLLITDGLPNCGAAIPTNCDFTDVACIQMAQAKGEQIELGLAVDKIKAFAANGIKTHVIGFGTKVSPELAKALDMMALAGDTNRDSHWPVEDTQALITALDSVSADAIGCDVVLEQPLASADKLRVDLDGNELLAGDPDGFSLASDRSSIRVQGTACQKLRDGKDHKVDLRVVCAP